MIATNYVDIAVHLRDFHSPGIGEIWSPDPDLRVRFEALGYRVAADPVLATLWVTTGLDAKGAAHVRQGGRLLIFPGGEIGLSPLFPHWQNVKVRRRAGTIWRGDGHRALAGCIGPAHFCGCRVAPCWMKPSTECCRNMLSLAAICSISKPGFMPGWSSAGFTNRWLWWSNAVTAKDGLSCQPSASFVTRRGPIRPRQCCSTVCLRLRWRKVQQPRATAKP